MKKIISILLCAVMLIAAAACAAPASQPEKAAESAGNDSAEDKTEDTAEEKTVTAVPREIIPLADGECGIRTEDSSYLDRISFNRPQMLTDDFYIRDPFVLLCDGVYFMYGSNIISPKIGNCGFSVYASLDLEHWIGPYDLTGDTVDWTGCDYFWAPEVYYRDGEFYMLVSYRDTETECIGCATLKGTSPLGPFVMVSDGWFTGAAENALDAHLYIAPDGQPWCLYTRDWSNEICAAKFSDDLTELIGEPTPLMKSSNVKWTTNKVCEAPFIYTMEDGTLCMLWAGFNRWGYFVGTATADNVLGPWTMQDAPLYDQTTSRAGEDGGHAAAFYTRDGHLMLAFHTPNAVDYAKGIIETAKFVEVAEDGGYLKMTKAIV